VSSQHAIARLRGRPCLGRFDLRWHTPAVPAGSEGSHALNPLQPRRPNLIGLENEACKRFVAWAKTQVAAITGDMARLCKAAALLYTPPLPCENRGVQIECTSGVREHPRQAVAFAALLEAST
jgi:hypothetical protein